MNAFADHPPIANIQNSVKQGGTFCAGRLEDVPVRHFCATRIKGAKALQNLATWQSSTFHHSGGLNILRVLLAAVAALIGVMILTPGALAREAPPEAIVAPGSANSVYHGDWLIVGVGGVYGPDYDGAKEYGFNVVPVVMGNVRGIGISARSAGLALNVIPSVGHNFSFKLGPSVGLNSTRATKAKDPVVERLGTLKRAVEVGVATGIDFNEVFNSVDMLSFNLDARWDVNGASNGMIVDPSVAYFTPVNKGMAVAVSFGALHGDGNFMDYYFSVTPAGSAASGLPVFRATSGWMRANVTIAMGIDLDGNLYNGGFLVGLIGNYSRLLGDAAASPITRDRGSANEWQAGLGIGYAF